ncbi:24558_t:CDS:1 [Cetraspora pellucida]|uniref:24558_t:CDS:1 n=1 Tax=Cetraspora pellucida TaxID=1433469 RepID=A0A9N9H163_9GLOM|nr:24558_t:CDS:1 [Cetraspora pellucida]
MQDLANIIIILNIRSAKVVTLHIINYEPGKSNPPEWYKSSYSWYCIKYIKNKGEAKNNPEPRQFLSMKKNPKRAKELLTWIQDAIATKKLCNPVFSINGKCSTGVFSKFLKSYGITTKRLRKIRSKHASKVHDDQNPTLQYLEFLSRVVMRHKMDHHNSGMYYTEDDTSDLTLTQIQILNLKP